MKQASLDGPRTKLLRAHAHLKTLYGELNEFTNGPKTHDVITEVESDTVTEGGREIVMVAKIKVLRTPGDDWGLLLGDFVQNLRAALDHLVYQLVLLNGAKPSRNNQFPISTSGTRYWCARKNGTPSMRDRMLAGVSENHRAGIDAVQPYRGGPEARQTPLAVLSDLSNTDKHQVIHTAFVSSLPVDESAFDLETTIEGAIADISHRTGLLEDGAEVTRTRIVLPDPDAREDAHRHSLRHRLRRGWVRIRGLQQHLRLRPRLPERGETPVRRRAVAQPGPCVTFSHV